MLMKNLTWKSSSHAGWWWCSVARTHVLRKTRVTMSQNIHWDLQMFRHFLRIDRFHLNRHNYLTFVTNSSIEMLIVQWQMLPLIVTFASVYGRYLIYHLCLFLLLSNLSHLLFKAFHSFLPWSLSDMLPGFSCLISHFSCNSNWNYHPWYN